MKFANVMTGATAVLLAGLALTLAAPKAAHALAAALVQVTNTTANPVPTAPAVPGNPFFAYMQLSGFGTQSVGPGTGTLGVTQLVLTNTGSTVAEVNVFAGLLTGGTCGGNNNVAAGTNPFQVFEVPANSSLVVPAPTPLVFTPEDGYDNQNHTCVAAGMPITGGNVFVSVNGFVN
jgi:hypothetical protein